MFGLLFTGFGLWFLGGDANIWHLDWEWVWPSVLLVAGAMVLLSLRPRRDGDEEDAAGEIDAW